MFGGGWRGVGGRIVRHVVPLMIIISYFACDHRTPPSPVLCYGFANRKSVATRVHGGYGAEAGRVFTDDAYVRFQRFPYLPACSGQAGNGDVVLKKNQSPKTAIFLPYPLENYKKKKNVRPTCEHTERRGHTKTFYNTSYYA